MTKRILAAILIALGLAATASAVASSASGHVVARAPITHYYG